jgi:hypothetical protein
VFDSGVEDFPCGEKSLLAECIPDVMVSRKDPARAPFFTLKTVKSVPASDVENGFSVQIGQLEPVEVIAFLFAGSHNVLADIYCVIPKINRFDFLLYLVLLQRFLSAGCYTRKLMERQIGDTIAFIPPPVKHKAMPTPS